MKLNWWTVENMQASVLVIDLCCSCESVLALRLPGHQISWMSEIERVSD